MSSNHHSTDDRQMQEREVLCALFDGELQGDEARFALKRLGHDVQWREAVGRWQLYGDVLRGQSAGLAAGGFAERVSLAIARESAPQQVAPAKLPVHRRGWIGGALAASVAVVALFITRPFTDEPATSPGNDVATTQIASAGGTAAVAPVRPSIPVPAPARPAPDQATLGLSAAAVAVAEVPRRVADRRTSRSQNQRAAMRNSRQSQAPAAVAVSAPLATTAIATAGQIGRTEVAPALNPFRPEHAEATVRPWPRAVLPQYSAGSGAMTASFGGSAASPSFYPFEPTQGPQVDQGQSDGSDTPR